MAIMKSCLLDRLGLGGGVDLYSGTPPRGQGEVREAGRAKAMSWVSFSVCSHSIGHSELLSGAQSGNFHSRLSKKQPGKLSLGRYQTWC